MLSVIEVIFSDAIFCYFEKQPDARTMSVLGVAFAKGKPIFVGLNPELVYDDECAAAVEIASFSLGYAAVRSVREAWDIFVNKIRVDLRVVRGH